MLFQLMSSPASSHGERNAGLLSGALMISGPKKRRRRRPCPSMPNKRVKQSSKTPAAVPARVSTHSPTPTAQPALPAPAAALTVANHADPAPSTSAAAVKSAPPAPAAATATGNAAHSAQAQSAPVPSSARSLSGTAAYKQVKGVWNGPRQIYSKPQEVLLFNLPDGLAVSNRCVSGTCLLRTRACPQAALKCQSCL